VLSDDLAANVVNKLARSTRNPGTDVVVIPNFVDMTLFEEAATGESYRTEFGLGSGPIVMYAGNLGFSQSLDLVVGLAEARPHLTVVINGDGAARASLETDADRLPNLHLIDYQPAERLPEVLAAADIHLVPLKSGLGSVSVPSKTYSILAARRPVIASIDRGTAIEHLLNESGAGIVVDPDRPGVLIEAVDALIEDAPRRAEMGSAGHRWVSEHASPETAAVMYERVLSGSDVG
jgi:colanic acid biosynthesis glycosyl transferase WcaI